MDIKIFIIVNEKDAKDMLDKLESLGSEEKLGALVETLRKASDRHSATGFE